MFVIHGLKTARIKTYKNVPKTCMQCYGDLKASVYGEYYHFYYIPAFPNGIKNAVLQCTKCGERRRIYELEKEYEKRSWYPFYFYTVPLFVAILVITLVVGNIQTQKQKAAYIKDPQIADVYTIAKRLPNGTLYSFMRLVGVTRDSVLLIANEVEYPSFASSMQAGDHFIKDSIIKKSRKELQQMLDDATINNVDRTYSEKKGFDQFR